MIDWDKFFARTLYTLYGLLFVVIWVEAFLLAKMWKLI